MDGFSRRILLKVFFEEFAQENKDQGPLIQATNLEELEVVLNCTQSIKSVKIVIRMKTNWAITIEAYNQVQV